MIRKVMKILAPDAKVLLTEKKRLKNGKKT